MIDIFNIANTAPQDKSIEYLRTIFGAMSNVLMVGGTGTAESITLLSTLFRVFNTAMLAVGTLLVVYVVVVGVMKTAHEGEAMGRHWSSMWIPIRIVLGIAGLFPTATGYCAIQIIFMWIVVQGIGAADSLWNTALAYIKTTGSPYAQITVPTTGVSQQIQTLFAGIACDATLRQTGAIPNNDVGNYYCNKNPGNVFCNAEFPNIKPGQAAAYTPYQFGPNGVCGKLETNCDILLTTNTCNGAKGSTLSCKACAAQQEALKEIVTQQKLIADNLALIDFSYRNFYINNNPAAGNVNTQYIYDFCSAGGKSRDQCCLSADPSSSCQRYDSGFFPKPNAASTAGGSDDPQNPSIGAIQTIYWPYAIKPLVDVDGSVDFIGPQVDHYINSLKTVAKEYNDSILSKTEDIGTLDQEMRNAASTGWLFAGAFYYTIGRTNTGNQTAMPTVTFSAGKLTNDYANYRINDKAAAELISLAKEHASEEGASPDTSPQGGEYSKPLKSTSDNIVVKGMAELVSGIMRDVGESFREGAKSGRNPMFAIQQIGMTMLGIVETVFGVFLGITIALAILLINPLALGTGAVNVGPMLIYLLLVPAIYGLLGIMSAYGGLLGIYVPLIPFMIFTGGAITWFLLVLEAIVAGPLVAIGIMMPGGQHDVLGRAEPALMLLFNIFLRPSLMVLGMLAGMLISTALLQMIFYTFWQIVIPGTTSAVTGYSSFILAWIFYLGAFVALAVTVVNKSYAAIYLLPDRVITWIGGHAAQLGVEAEMEREGKGAVERAGQGMGAAGQRMGESIKGTHEAGKAVGRDVKQKRAEEAKAEKKGHQGDVEGE